ncbi:MAG TPA: methyltransferase domain-containing protein [Gemmatimonadaceae bacterium]|nr:methyltransferase domain-containing protein [Gemmatimonadaceae bacterium]
MTSAPPATEIKPISHRSTNDKVFALLAARLPQGGRVVDVGAGEGYFSQMVGGLARQRGVAPAELLSACDVFPENFRYADIGCDRIEWDGRLPYADASFDVACSLEVVEHVEDQFLFARELHRIVRPGGTAIVSTPNVLNVNSRLRTLHSGFPVLFDPLSLSSRDPVHTSGHINPVSYYYLAYQLYRAGFRAVEVHYDRSKSSARFLTALLWPFIAAGRAAFGARLRRKRPEEAAENAALLADLNSVGMLTSRSVIAVATR